MGWVRAHTVHARRRLYLLARVVVARHHRHPLAVMGAARTIGLHG